MAATALFAPVTVVSALGSAGPTDDTTTGDTSTGDITTGDTTRSADIDDADIVAAKEGLAGFLAANPLPTPTTSNSFVGCPIVELDVLEVATSELLRAPVALLDWGTEIEWSEYQDIDPDLQGVACTGAADGDTHDTDDTIAAGVAAIDITDVTTFDDFLDVVIGSDVEWESGTFAGGDSRQHCFDEDETGDTNVCFEFWARDSLVLAYVVFGSEVGQPALGSSLDDLVPLMVEHLAAAHAEAAEPSSPAGG